MRRPAHSRRRARRLRSRRDGPVATARATRDRRRHARGETTSAETTHADQSDPGPVDPEPTRAATPGAEAERQGQCRHDEKRREHGAAAIDPSEGRGASRHRGGREGHRPERHRPQVGPRRAASIAPRGPPPRPAKLDPWKSRSARKCRRSASARARPSTAKASSPSPRRCSSRASPTSAATRARRYRTCSTSWSRPSRT